MKSLRVGVGVVCARILAVYILMLIGGIVGWGLFTCLSQPLTAGRQLWGICLFAYSVAFAYVFPIVTYIT